MKIDRYDETLFQEMIRFRQDIVFLNLSGNYIYTANLNRNKSLLLAFRPVARYGLPPPPSGGNFVDHDFLKASCLATFLQHARPLAMEALPSNSPLHMLPIQRHKFNIKRTEVRIHVICSCSIKNYFI